MWNSFHPPLHNILDRADCAVLALSEDPNEIETDRILLQVYV